MKKTVLLLLLASISALGAIAQTPVASVNENFNTSCPTGHTHPNGWLDFNPIPATIPDGQWHCTGLGRNASGGALCTNYWTGSFHLDTAYLISPRLNFSSYTDSIYVRFDSKTTKIHLGGKLSLVATTDSSSQQGYIDVGTTLMNPVFGPDDSTDWTTHSINMTPYKDFGDFYLAFRFTGTDTTGSIWYLDNIYTTTSPLTVPGNHPRAFKLAASGNCATGTINISYEITQKEQCNLAIYDLVGRRLHTQSFMPAGYAGNLQLNDLYLSEGVYIVRMESANAAEVQKIFIR